MTEHEYIEYEDLKILQGEMDVLENEGKFNEGREMEAIVQHIQRDHRVGTLSSKYPQLIASHYRAFKARELKIFDISPK
jgi:hypothetical protein